MTIETYEALSVAAIVVCGGMTVGLIVIDYLVGRLLDCVDWVRGY